MKTPHSFVLVGIYAGLLFICMMLVRETVKEPQAEYVDSYDSSKYISVKAENAMRSLCSKSNYLMRLYGLRQDEVFAGMEAGVDTSSTIKRIDNQIENILGKMDKEREILKDEGVFDLADQNCQYLP